ncbi:glycerophosphodiester phosphodiesterase [Haloferax mediterranei ATCC 33500]|uniref:Glycerophosphodiester phosphodiesterase n=1 Tax=Haloferax mediterranei (strain ATCC 33500 / DSM 1411 / JCM 8866 / NBRC 14739 / NCIMB 2177 / R-4) TaxID=523841 RepID=I3R7F3_HALMT|nr:glycerophosphodiester phosphodiesterase family protein [Haloferax mediterranei]AFK20163.1 glycerophosphodiester phosphodiesterase [Haloferax mediterranei ATCC 33500]AHZ23537.1 glycerophosphodiester phosphodiesterase [Haloferax mediterranei ATCC 33500]ELZ99712.1 glycerophosphodiester phosphodiesterase [Haloferax mediterranei ATCC 33500]MDX5987084.1 glycerophosphodiester phosphodiesterase family protein [Haloferax mediterranei ATCC 33500]QCQ76399.1 glycerophosphodiester phosphodiesterase [Hal
MRAIGHRGCPALAPENTLAAFTAAAERLDWVELDVRRCASGELVVFHDETLDRLTDVDGSVAETPLSDLREVTIGSSDEPIPTLAEVFEVLPDDIAVNVELKEDGLASDLGAIVADAPNEVLVSSFDADALREVREATDLPVAFLFADDWNESLDIAAELDCTAIHPYYELLSEARIEDAHDAGFEVNTWTVPDRGTVEKLRDWGVDGVVIDNPAFAE